MDHHALSASSMDDTGSGQSRRPPPLSFDVAHQNKLEADKESKGDARFKAPDNGLVAAFCTASNIPAVATQDEPLLRKVCSWQGEGLYPGVDEWTAVELPAGTRLFGGLPGQSEYYTIEQSLQDAELDKQAYWESLQVKAHDLFGYRPKVGVYVLTAASNGAIAKTTANPQYGKGGAWQVFIDDFRSKLECIEEVALT
jgi:hypothetical protein